MSAELRDGDVVGLAWGNTLAATIDAYEPVVNAPKGVRYVSFSGGTSVARPRNAPAFFESPHVRYLLMKEPGIRATLKLAERTTVALMCIGGLEDSTVRDLGTFTQRDVFRTAREWCRRRHMLVVHRRERCTH